MRARLAKATRLCSQLKRGVRLMKRITSFLVAVLLTLTASLAADACTTIAGGTLEPSFNEAVPVAARIKRIYAAANTGKEFKLDGLRL